MSKARFFLAFIAAMALGGCGDSDESVENAESRAEGVHHTLGTWPNVVVINADAAKVPQIDDQRTAADILIQILELAVVDAGDPTKLGPAKFAQLVDLIVKCAQTATAKKTAAHTVSIMAALEHAGRHTQPEWDLCLNELGHGH